MQAQLPGPGRPWTGGPGPGVELGRWLRHFTLTVKLALVVQELVLG
jgi:hypothetical protein